MKRSIRKNHFVRRAVGIAAVGVMGGIGVPLVTSLAISSPAGAVQDVCTWGILPASVAAYLPPICINTQIA